MLPQLDAILLDMHLPETDAYDICQALKQDPRLRRIPIIIMTHQLTEDLPQRVRQNGCAGLVVRPFSRKQFGVYLRRIVSGDRPVGNGVH
jgi:CheY-like chemotaxis protein